MVVRREHLACQRVSGAPDSRSSLLVRCLRLWLGRSSGGPFRLGSLVQSRTPVIDQPAGTLCHSSLTLPFSVSSSGSDRSILRQHDDSGVPLAPRGDVFPCSQRGNAAATPLGGVALDFARAAVHLGHQECCGVFLEPLSVGTRLRVAPGSGCRDGASGQVAGDDRSFWHLAELLPSSVFFSVRQSHVCRD